MCFHNLTTNNNTCTQPFRFNICEDQMYERFYVSKDYMVSHNYQNPLLIAV